MKPRRTARWRLMLASAMLSLTLFGSGCATTSEPPLEPSGCSWAKPLTWHDKDTPTTQREIFSHNLKWEEFCGNKTGHASR